MKTKYVLIDDVISKKREARKARQARTQNKNIQVGESMIGRVLPRPPAPAPPPPGLMISDPELRLMKEIVHQSGYFESHKTGDVGQDLIREFIR